MERLIAALSVSLGNSRLADAPELEPGRREQGAEAEAAARERADGSKTRRCASRRKSTSL